MAQYRLLQYVVDPFTAWGRATVAALIEDDRVRVVLAPASRVQHELGRARAEALLTALADDIEAIDSFDRLPRAFGPQFVLTPPEQAPERDVLRWVEHQLAHVGG